MKIFFKLALAGLTLLLLIPACLQDRYGMGGPGSEIIVKWTAYKLPDMSKRVPVSGTFTSMSVGLQSDGSDHQSQHISCFSGAELSINTHSAQIPTNFEATQNLIEFFFKHFTDEITGRVLNIDDSAANIEIVINEIPQTVEFKVLKVENDLILQGRIEDIRLFFTDNDPLMILNSYCGSYHQDKVWEDVDIKVVIPNYRELL